MDLARIERGFVFDTGKLLCDKRCAATQSAYATEHSMNPPLIRRGKPIYQWGVRHLCSSSRHLCEGQHARTPSEASSIWINHYSFQSLQHWEAKKARGRTQPELLGPKGQVWSAPRVGPIPGWYSSVRDEQGLEAMRARVAALDDGELRRCVERVFDVRAIHFWLIGRDVGTPPLLAQLSA